MSEPELLTGNERLADGVLGYSADTDHGLYIPFIMAEVQGDGRVGKYLDSLPRDRRVVFPTILSMRLAEMLIRRGFHSDIEWSEDAGEHIEIMERQPE